MTMQEKLNEYARLAVVTGLAVIPGQEVMISASVDAADFVRLVVEQAYAAGASGQRNYKTALSPFLYGKNFSVPGVDKLNAQHHGTAKSRFFEHSLG